jgi:hypothetical protein
MPRRAFATRGERTPPQPNYWWNPSPGTTACGFNKRTTLILLHTLVGRSGYELAPFGDEIEGRLLRV